MKVTEVKPPRVGRKRERPDTAFWILTAIFAIIIVLLVLSHFGISIRRYGPPAY